MNFDSVSNLKSYRYPAPCVSDSDPDPDWIRIQYGQRIQIRTRIGNPYPDRPNSSPPLKKRKHKKF
jgi:hypothetical protein